MRRLLLAVPVMLLTIAVPVYALSARRPGNIATKQVPRPQVTLAAHVGAMADVQGYPGDALTRPQPKKKVNSLASLRFQMADLLRDKQGTYGVYIFELGTGDSAGVNETSVFPTASTFKVPMDMYIFDLVRHGKADLNEHLTYLEDDYEEGTGVLQDQPVGGTYTVKELMELAITQSDNVATNMLLRRFGRPNVWDYETRLGGKVVYQDDLNVSTPADMALYMRELFNPQIVAPEHRDMLLTWLKNTAFHDRLEAGLPPGVTLAHKIGTLPGVCNDVGVVFGARHTYVIAVMSRDVDEDYAAGVLADLSALVYNHAA